MKKPTLAKPTLNKPQAALAFAEAAKNKKVISEGAARVFNAPEGHRRLTINLPIDLHKKLKLAAIHEDATATDIVLRLLQQELK